MKRIAGLPVAPDGLARFVADPSLAQTWDGFGSFEAGAAKRELTAALVHAQHGLCAYCEVDLATDDTQVEHVVPQRGPNGDANRTLDHANLLACCMGGSNANFGPQARQPDPARFLPPVRGNLSCGQAKGNRPASGFLDPRAVPAQPSLMRVDEDGRLRSDPAACATHGELEPRVAAHIDGLGLNVGRLRNQREAVRAALTAAYQAFATLAEDEMRAGLMALAERDLLPDAQGGLARFFTTTRSFFGPLAERILDRPPQAWL